MKRRIMPPTLLILSTVLATLAAFAPGGLAQGSPGADTAGAVIPSVGVVAYYFHGNVRCTTCRTIERLAHETIAADFPDELASGALAWRALNVDERANEHFVEDFKLVTRSLVLVSYRDGEVVRFQNLDKVWQLVRDEAAFSQYVRESTRAFLDEG